MIGWIPEWQTGLQTETLSWVASFSDRVLKKAWLVPEVLENFSFSRNMDWNCSSSHSFLPPDYSYNLFSFSTPSEGWNFPVVTPTRVAIKVGGNFKHDHDLTEKMGSRSLN